VGLNASDFLVIVAYLAAVTLFGLRFRRKQTSLKGYFLADNKISWWAISLSIVAAETSTLTIISVPGLAYEQDFRFLQLVFGYIVGRVIVALLLIPHYFRGDLITAYQLIDRRFGRRRRGRPRLRRRHRGQDCARQLPFGHERSRPRRCRHRHRLRSHPRLYIRGRHGRGHLD
jgi:hypothetical protein